LILAIHVPHIGKQDIYTSKGREEGGRARKEKKVSAEWILGTQVVKI
jgi:hypothetical protein